MDMEVKLMQYPLAQPTHRTTRLCSPSLNFTTPQKSPHGLIEWCPGTAAHDAHITREPRDAGTHHHTLNSPWLCASRRKATTGGQGEAVQQRA